VLQSDFQNVAQVPVSWKRGLVFLHSHFIGIDNVLPPCIVDAVLSSRHARDVVQPSMVMQADVAAAPFGGGLVAAIMDGADWEQGFADYHCLRAIRILDFAHAAEHVNNIGESLFGEHTPESHAWLKERLHCLKYEGPEKLLLEFQGLQRQYPQAQAVSGNLAYLEKRKDQIQYPQFQSHAGSS
jgi:hypothetical protein